MRWPAGKARGRGRKRRVRVSVCERVCERVPANACGKERSRDKRRMQEEGTMNKE